MLTLSFIYSAGNLLYLKSSCWHCNDFYIRKTKQGFHDRKTEYFRANELLIGIEDACVNNGDFSTVSLFGGVFEICKGLNSLDGQLSC